MKVLKKIRFRKYSFKKKGFNEEKGHAEHLTQLLLKYDSDQYNGLE